MTTKKTPEARAEERFPDDITGLCMYPTPRPSWTCRENRAIYATCIREEVEPLEEWKESAIKVMAEWDKVHVALGSPGKLGESMAAASLAEVVKLRALVQELVNSIGTCGTHVNETRTVILHYSIFAVSEALSSAKKAGFVPTNTTEG